MGQRKRLGANTPDLKVRFSSLWLCPEFFPRREEERKQTALFSVKIKMTRLLR